MNTKAKLQLRNNFIAEHEHVISGYTLKLLNKETTKQYVEVLTTLIDQIPLVSYTKDDILAESKDKGERIFYGKWEHSLVLFDQDTPIAVVIAYERKSENNDQYPKNTIYLSELAVDKNYQRRGIARKILQTFFEMNRMIGLLYLDGETNFSVQTNSAKWNMYVQNLYTSFGFVQRAEKVYSNRTDVILGWTPINKETYAN